MYCCYLSLSLCMFNWSVHGRLQSFVGSIFHLNSASRVTVVLNGILLTTEQWIADRYTHTHVSVCVCMRIHMNNNAFRAESFTQFRIDRVLCLCIDVCLCFGVWLSNRPINANVLQLTVWLALWLVVLFPLCVTHPLRGVHGKAYYCLR